MLNPEELRALPEVAPHDHLDGRLRPTTVVEHCAENGHELPTTDPGKLGRWFLESADSGSLVHYPEGFARATAAMQTRDQLTRVTREFVLGQAADGVVYTGARWAPKQHLEEGLTPKTTVEATRDSLAEGMTQAEATGRAIIATQIITTTCHIDEPTADIAELTLAYRDNSVVGYDIAGAEMGFRPTRFQASFGPLQRNNAYFTIHTGEADGPRSIWEAVQLCGAQRIDRGVRVCEDIEDFWGDRPGPGWFAAFVRDRQIPLEMCLTSNLQTDVAKSLNRHPIGRLAGLGFNITIHCDNRLMSGTSLFEKFTGLSETFRWGFAEVEAVTVAATHAAFLHHDERGALIEGLIRPAFHATCREVRT